MMISVMTYYVQNFIWLTLLDQNVRKEQVQMACVSKKVVPMFFVIMREPLNLIIPDMIQWA